MDIGIKLIGLNLNIRLTHAMIRPNSVFYQFGKMSLTPLNVFLNAARFQAFFVLKVIQFLYYIPDHCHFLVNISNCSRIVSSKSHCGLF